MIAIAFVGHTFFIRHLFNLFGWANPARVSCIAGAWGLPCYVGSLPDSFIDYLLRAVGLVFPAVVAVTGWLWVREHVRSGR